MQFTYKPSPLRSWEGFLFCCEPKLSICLLAHRHTNSKPLTAIPTMLYSRPNYTNLQPNNGGSIDNLLAILGYLYPGCALGSDGRAS